MKKNGCKPCKVQSQTKLQVKYLLTSTDIQQASTWEDFACLFINSDTMTFFYNLFFSAIQNGGLSLMLSQGYSSFGNTLGGLGIGPLGGPVGGPAGSLVGSSGNGLMGPTLGAGVGTGEGVARSAGPGMGVLQVRQISDLWRNNVHPVMRGQGGEDEEVAAEDEEDMGVIETYSNYMPSKLRASE